jgi:hypothetical protein
MKNIFWDLSVGRRIIFKYVRFEVFTAVTMKNAVFYDVAQCRSCVNRRFRLTSVQTRSTRRHIPEDDILQYLNSP